MLHCPCFFHFTGLLFSLLDAEGNSRLLQHIRETIISLLTALVAKNLKHWFGLCKQVLLASNVEEETQQEKQNEQGKDSRLLARVAIKILEKNITIQGCH